MLKKDASYQVQPTDKKFLSNKASKTFEPFHTLIWFQSRWEGECLKHLLVRITLGLKNTFFDIYLHKDEGNI